MRKVVLVVMAWAVAATAGAQAADSAADRAAGERAERYLERFETLRADFVQQLFDKGGTLRDESRGTVALSKPGRFRWDYRQPAQQVLVCDGRSVWLYDAELEQVTVRQVGESLSHTPAMLLAGKGRTSDAFDARDGGQAGGLQWVLLTPRRDDAEFSSVRLGFRGRELERLDLEDGLGQTTRITFSRVERNPALPPALFTFVPPPGVDVVGAAAPH